MDSTGFRRKALPSIAAVDHFQKTGLPSVWAQRGVCCCLQPSSGSLHDFLSPESRCVVRCFLVAGHCFDWYWLSHSAHQCVWQLVKEQERLDWRSKLAAVSLLYCSDGRKAEWKVWPSWLHTPLPNAFASRWSSPSFSDVKWGRSVDFSPDVAEGGLSHFWKERESNNANLN